MSVFRTHNTNADRSAADRSRHKKKIEKAIKEGIHDIVAEESIIGQDGKKQIRIPVRGIKQYRFIYGSGNGSKGVGSAQGKDLRKGQILKEGTPQQGSGSGKGGNEKGEEYYDVEISLDELAKYLFDDLKLPDLERKSSSNIFSEMIKRKGYRHQGIRVRLSKKETLKNKIRRRNSAERNGSYDPESDESFPFHEDDLMYKHIDVKIKPITNAVIFFIMDVSGSMDKTKKFLARSFFFLLYQFIRFKYEKVELVFISHTTEGKEVSEDDFFKSASTGGTHISSGLLKELEIVKDRFPSKSWNIYSFHCSDGENWDDDNAQAFESMKKVIDLSQMSAYIQINHTNEKVFGQEMSKLFAPLESEKFKLVKIVKKEDIWPQFTKLFGGATNE